MAKTPKIADEQKPAFRRYKAPKHAGEVHLPTSGLKRVRRGVIDIPADAIHEHELLIRAGFVPVVGDAGSEPEQDGDDDAPAEQPAE